MPTKFTDLSIAGVPVRLNPYLPKGGIVLVDQHTNPVVYIQDESDINNLVLSLNLLSDSHRLP